MKQKTANLKLRVQKLSSYTLISFGLFLNAILIPAAITVEASELAAMAGAVIAFGILPLVSGVILLNSVNKKIKKEIEDFNEKLTLKIAKENKGILTATEFSQQTDFNIADSGKILDSMVVRGIAQADVTDEGLIEYRFPNFID